MAGTGFRALAIIGDYYHSGKDVKEMLLTASPETVEWSWSTVPPVLKDEKLRTEDLLSFRIIVMAAENRIDPQGQCVLWMDDDFALALKHWVAGGGVLFTLHSGMASYPDQGIYNQLVGGAFAFHPSTHPEFTIVPEKMQNSHPLLQGISSFSISDELYFVDRDPDRSTLLAKTDCPRFGSSSAFWYRLEGKGKVLALTPAHRRESMLHPMMLKILQNAFLWALE